MEADSERQRDKRYRGKPILHGIESPVDVD